MKQCRVCSKCGHEAEEGEMFSIFVDSNAEWRETLYKLPQYCKKCANELREIKKRKNMVGQTDE